MATTPLAYNPTLSPISGADLVGSLAVGTTAQAYSQQPGGVRWWMSPSDTVGYIIAHTTPAGNQPTRPGINPPNASLGFWRTKTKSDAAFIGLAEYVTRKAGSPQTFLNSSTALSWLNTNGYWTSYTLGPVTTNLIANWDIQNSSSYSGSGSIITDLQGNINGTITGTISYTNASPKYLTIEGGVSEYIYTANINPYLSPVNTGKNQSIFMWIYPTSNGIIYSEQGSLTPDGGWYDTQIQRNTAGNFLFGVWPYSFNTPLITSTLTYALNNWYYVGWTYNGTTLTGYVNGSSVGSTTIARQTPYSDGGNIPMYFNLGYPTVTDMATTTNSTYRFGGLQIYNSGISSGDVLTNFNNTKSTYGL